MLKKQQVLKEVVCFWNLIKISSICDLEFKLEKTNLVDNMTMAVSGMPTINHKEQIEGENPNRKSATTAFIFKMLFVAFSPSFSKHPSLSISHDFFQI